MDADAVRTVSHLSQVFGRVERIIYELDKGFPQVLS